MLTLSICIPSYNRFEKLRETVKKILEAKSTDFEIMIVDNCSPRNIDDIISFDDSRLRIIKRDIAVSGIKNISDSLFLGNAKYSLILLDKDQIKGDRLDDFIHILSENEVMGGYCEINSKDEYYEVVDSSTVKRFGFLSKHPSGDFYNVRYLKSFVLDNSEKLDYDAFNFDIYLAYCASRGKMLYYNSPLIESSLDKIEKEDLRSLTFSQENSNLFYMPQKRIEEFKGYVNYLFNLDIKLVEKRKTMMKLAKRTLYNVTWEYRSIMVNTTICNHYGHKTKKIRFIDMLHYQKCLINAISSLEQVESILKYSIIIYLKLLFGTKSILMLFKEATT